MSLAIIALANGLYIAAERDGHALTASRTMVGDWERFEIEDRGNGTVAIRSCWGYVSAQVPDDGRLEANRSVVDAWELFQLVPQPDGMAVRSCATGRFVSADRARGGILIANRPEASTWERFIPGSDGMINSLTTMERHPLGAHLVRNGIGSLYTHHGIYIGNGRVIHYSGLGSSVSGPVCEVSLDEFASGNGVWVQDHPGARFPPGEVVARARSRLGESRYHVWSNNCEHFCHWAIDDQSISPQIDAIKAGGEVALKAIVEANRPPWVPPTLWVDKLQDAYREVIVQAPAWGRQTRSQAEQVGDLATRLGNRLWKQFGRG